MTSNEEPKEIYSRVKIPVEVKEFMKGQPRTFTYTECLRLGMNAKKAIDARKTK